MKTIEEKKKLITDFKASGLSMTKWCKEQGIATSTMSKWIKKYAPQQQKAKFIEIPKTIKEKRYNKPIVIEYKDFKISISESLMQLFF